MSVVNIHAQYSGPCTLTVRSLYICHLCIFILDVMHSLEHMYPDPYCDVIKTSWKLQSLIPYHMLQFLNVKLLFVSMLATFVKIPTD